MLGRLLDENACVACGSAPAASPSRGSAPLGEGAGAGAGGGMAATSAATICSVSAGSTVFSGGSR